MTIMIGIICLVVGFIAGSWLTTMYHLSKAPVWDGGDKHNDKYED